MLLFKCFLIAERKIFFVTHARFMKFFKLLIKPADIFNYKISFRSDSSRYQNKIFLVFQKMYVDIFKLNRFSDQFELSFLTDITFLRVTCLGLILYKQVQAWCLRRCEFAFCIVSKTKTIVPKNFVNIYVYIDCNVLYVYARFGFALLIEINIMVRKILGNFLNSQYLAK